MATLVLSSSCLSLVSASLTSKALRRVERIPLSCKMNMKKTPPGALCFRKTPQISSFFNVADNGRSGIPFLKVLPKHMMHNIENATLKRLIPPTLCASLLMVSPPAHALSFDLPENWLQIFLIVGSFAIIYLFVVPLFLYYYLERRWFKRKMAEAILQFGLVFLFFPGMLLLAPFINFRSLPRDGAKEPWDEIRPL